MRTEDKILLVSRELTIENTTFCGAKCLMCCRDKYKYEYQHMDTKLFKEIIDQGVEVGMLSLDACGFGDPFMDPQYKDKLAYVKTKYPFLKVYTSTTGQLLFRDRLTWACQYIDTLKISHYGFTKPVFEKVHGGTLKFEKVSKNIQELLSIPQNRRPYIIMQFLILPENEHELEEWKMYWEPKVDEILIWLPHNYGGGRYSNHLANTGIQDSKPRSCGRPFKGNLFIRENGEVSMCCYDYNRQLIIGDLRHQTIKEVIEGVPLKKIRKVHTDETFNESNYICKDCDQIYPRNHALVYASNSVRKVGILTSHPDLVNDMLSNEKIAN